MSVQAAMEDRAAIGFGMYMAGTALRVVPMAFDVATYEFRPGLWVDVSRTLTGLAFNPEARTAVADEVLRDPFGFAAEVAGGAYLGGVLKQAAGAAYGKGKKLWRESKTVPYSISKEAYYPAEYEMGLQFPEEIVGTEPTYRTFEKRWLKFEGEGIKGELPYYGATEAKTPGAEPRAFDIPGDEWSPEQLIKEIETAVPYEYGGIFDPRGGFLRVKGGYGGMKPFAEPKPPLPPRAEALVVTAEAAPNTKISNLIRQFNRVKIETELEFIPDIETITAHRTGYKFITPETVRPPSATLKFLDISKAATLSLSKVKSFDKVFTTPTVNLRQIEQQAVKQLEKPLDMGLPTLKQPQIPGLTPTQTPTQTPIEKPKLDQLQIPILDLPQITIPDIPVPEEPPPPAPPQIIIEPPSTRPRRLIKGELFPTKKKKGKRGRKGVYEFRVDFKEPKLPDIEDIKIPGFEEPGTKKKKKKKKATKNTRKAPKKKSKKKKKSKRLRIF